MGTVISNLKAKFGVDTTDFKKGLKEGEKSVDDFKGAAGDQLEKFADMFGVNMSGVNDAIGTATKSLGFLKQSFIAAAKGGDILTISAKVLKWALVSTGIGAIVVLLGTVIAYFAKSGEGSDKFAKILMQLKSVLNNVVERLVAFGEGIVDIFSGRFKEGAEKMRTAFKGIGAEIKEDWKAAGDLADAEDALEDKEISLIASLEERRAKIAELRLQAKEEKDDQRKKLELLKQAEAITKTVYADQIGIERERLRLMKEKLAISSKDPTDAQRRELAEQEAKINELYRSQAEDLKAIAREKKTAAEAVEAEFKQFQSFSNIKMPQMLSQKAYENINNSLKDLHHTMIKVKETSSALFEGMGMVAMDVAGSINTAFETLATGVGEFLGALLAGNAGVKDFGKLILGTFADMAINVGKIAIGAGLAVLGVKEALMTLNPAAAIAAGIALIAIGAAAKAAMASAAGGSSSRAATSSGFANAASYSQIKEQSIKLEINGKLTADGPSLAYVFNQESFRKKSVT
jgi:hypothetical protein